MKIISSLLLTLLVWRPNIAITILGAYSPLTMEGNIVVDGILVSCYASADHNLAHLGMTPMRWFPDIVDYIFGNDHVYVNIAKDLGRLALFFV